MRESLVVERRHDQQDRVGPCCRGFDDLHFIENEIFPQDRDAHGTADLCDVLQFSLKELLVG